MQLNTLDWTVVALSLVVTFLPVLFYARRSARGVDEFFASGRAAPWWLIGTSMVATTFSTDTPNLVTNFVRVDGVAKNWSWWAFLLTGMTTVFFYARLWRRSGILTDLEFYELRYAGKSAAFLRGFRAVYLGLVFNCIIMATVTLAAIKIANVMLGWPAERTVVVCAAICIIFGSISGLWGVLTTDLLQFVLAMIGVIAAAYYALAHPAVGGLSGLVTKVPPDTLRMLPDFDDIEGAISIFWVPILIQWWSVWYPGAEPGGGSYIAQRMLAARSERDAVAGTLWFNLAHYAIRPWPWIIVALASMIVFPTLDDIKRQLPHVDPGLIGHDLAYPAMLTLLPHGLLGLLVASLLAAYVSTMTTHMNWGTSYLVMDFYRRFLNPRSSGRQDVWLGRIVSALLVALSCWLSLYLSTAKQGFELLLSIGAGTGLIYLVRWYWWRVNPWSEMAAMGASLGASAWFFSINARGFQLPGDLALIGTVMIATIAWVVVTFVTPRVPRDTLIAFCRRVRPAGPGWAKIRREAGVNAATDHLGLALLSSLLGCAFIYAALFGTGKFLYGDVSRGLIAMAVFIGSGLGLWLLMRSIWRAPAAQSEA
ncbi:Sodium/glucose cotransporter [Phycisphaerae bacterium RAS1]|nr:Sodium/glucose cotransporter [Phycisphaerae bacterium RAS1]